jgi:hypothetical protein
MAEKMGGRKIKQRGKTIGARSLGFSFSEKDRLSCAAAEDEEVGKGTEGTKGTKRTKRRMGPMFARNCGWESYSPRPALPFSSAHAALDKPLKRAMVLEKIWSRYAPLKPN